MEEQKNGKEVVSVATQVRTLRDLFNSPAVRGEMAKALPKHITADKMIRLAMTAIQTTPKLLECSQMSLLGCVMGAAALGLELERFTGQAYLVPFYNKKTRCLEAQLIPGYRGLIALARRSGDITAVTAQAVYERDHFVYQFGLNERLDHTPAEGDRGPLRGAYAIFTFKDGSKMWDYLPLEEIEKVRNRSQAADSGPWMTDYAEMAKKTVIKRLVKLAPASLELQKAVDLDNRVMTGDTQQDLIGPPAGEASDAELAQQATDKNLAELKEKLARLQAGAGSEPADKADRQPGEEG